jgi:hypothetical protein
LRPSGLLSCQGEGDESPFVDDPEPKRVDHEDFRIRGRRPWEARFTAHAGLVLNIIQMVEYSPNVDGRLVPKYYQINFVSRLEFDIISACRNLCSRYHAAEASSNVSQYSYRE